MFFGKTCFFGTILAFYSIMAVTPLTEIDSGSPPLHILIETINASIQGGFIFCETCGLLVPDYS